MPLPPSPAPPGTAHQTSEAARRGVRLIFLANGTLFATWAVNIPGVRDQLGLSDAQIGLAVLAIGMGSLATMPLTGGWTARFGSHRVTALAAPLAMLTLLPPFLAPGFWTLVPALTLMGAANGTLDVAMNAQAVTVERRLARPILSRLHAYFSLGGVAGALLGTGLVGRAPIPIHVLLVTALLTVVVVAAGRRLVPDLPDPVRRDSGQGPSSPRSHRNPAVWLLGSLCFLGMLAEGANYDWAALYFQDALGLPGGAAGVGYAAFVAAMTLGRWFGDPLRTHLGDAFLVRGGALLTAAGLALALLVREPWLAALGFAVSGLGLSNVVPVLYGVAGHALAGRGIAHVATLGYAGFLLGPPIIGFLAEAWGLPAALGVAWAGAVLIALLGGHAFRRLHNG